jgi:predicted O-linked N-acetylglucosamine transferase (SPINDLY family)
LAKAEGGYRKILSHHPTHEGALLNLGIIEHQKGRHQVAIDLVRKVISLNPNFAEAYNSLGEVLRSLGRVDEAVGCYQIALAKKPNFAVAHHNLGSALQIQSKLDEAVGCYRAALAINPNFAEAYNSLGNALQGQGKLDDAVACYRKALDLRSAFAEVHNNLGNALQAQGKLHEAVDCYRRALALKPDYAIAYHNLGNALQAQNKLNDAVACYRRAIAIQADFAEVHNNLGNALRAQGWLDEAAAHYQQALAINPNFAVAHNNLGNVLNGQGKLDDAVASFRRALAINPNYPEAHLNLGHVLQVQDKLDEAVASTERALALRPNFAEAHNNLGNLLHAQGRLDGAIARYRQALVDDPDFTVAHSNLIFALNFDPRVGMEEQQRERASWYERHGRRYTASISKHENVPDPNRRLRIGYVSPYFRHQAATYAFAPVVLSHDSEAFEVVCYSDTIMEDDMTARFKSSKARWCRTVGTSDERLAEIIRTDGIDILVDLVGHMAGHRLLVFARKPAPIQVTGWGEPTGTGLQAMDYLFADPVLMPLGQRHLLSEQVADLPCFLSYWAPGPLPEPGPLPALANGYVTFGSFNRVAKISDAVLHCWSMIIRSVPRARIVLKDKTLNDSGQQKRVRTVLTDAGLEASQVILRGDSDRSNHFAAYNSIDIALDPFPHGGGMTTLDALWMGVPVVTTLGSTISSRLASSILTASGLEEFIADNREVYPALAISVASDLIALTALRKSLRARVAHSRFGDPLLYTRAVEAAYRTMWRRWCAGAQERAQ